VANALYDKGREAILNADIDWTVNDIRPVLVDAADYTINLATHDFYDDIPVGARVAVGAASIANKTATNGVADGDDYTFTAVTGDPCELIVLVNFTPGTDATRHLIAAIDTATGLPVIPNGGNITITWDNGANKIFKL
jgi:hypothetical protein